MLRQTCQLASLFGKVKLASKNANSALFRVPARYTREFRYPKVTYLPFDWDYPPKTDPLTVTGDRNMNIGFTEEVMKRVKKPFSLLPEIETAPEALKKVLSIEFATPPEQRRSIKDEFLSRVQRHPYDTKSMEYQIAKATFFIRSFMVVHKEYKSANIWKVRVLEAAARRNKLLKRLGRYDRERYEFVKQMLDIDHTFEPLEIRRVKITRKSELRRLTAEHAEKVKQDKMAAYHEKLKVLQKEFEVEKREAEEWIAKEIEELKLTDEEIKTLEYQGRIFP